MVVELVETTFHYSFALRPGGTDLLSFAPPKESNKEKSPLLPSTGSGSAGSGPVVELVETTETRRFAPSPTPFPSPIGEGSKGRGLDLLNTIFMRRKKKLLNVVD